MRVLLLIAMLLTVASGCGNPFEFDPATTVILKVKGIQGDTQREKIGESVKELVGENSTWHKMQTSTHNDTTMIKVSPVRDVQAYADRIEFGTVTSVEGNIIHVEVVDN